jgi:hypothetical protein
VVFGDAIVWIGRLSTYFGLIYFLFALLGEPPKKIVSYRFYKAACAAMKLFYRTFKLKIKDKPKKGIEIVF